MEKAQDSKALLIFLLLIIGSIMVYIFNKENELKDYKKATSAKIVDYTIEGGKKYIEYIFFVNGKKYTGKERVHSFKCNNGIEGCVGISFKVLYSSIDPNNCSIDLGKYNKFKARSRVFNLFN